MINISAPVCDCCILFTGACDVYFLQHKPTIFKCDKMRPVQHIVSFTLYVRYILHLWLGDITYKYILS